MIDDPYKELGVERGASQDDIKRAYRRKAKECHPDLHPNDPTATERMNRINEAYDMLTHPEKYQARQQQQADRQAYQNPVQGAYGQGQQSYGQQGGYYDPFAEMFGFGFGPRQQTYSGAFNPVVDINDPPLFRMAVNAINAKQYQAAVTHLNQVVSTGRNARWYYLSALAEHGMGNSVRALDFAQRAVQMEPNSQTYHAVLNTLRQGAQQYESQATSHGFNVHTMSPDKICTTLCLANLLCNGCLFGRGMYCCC